MMKSAEKKKKNTSAARSAHRLPAGKPPAPAAQANANALSDKKLLSQFKLAGQAIRAVVTAAFGAGKPADRVLAAFFRENRACGSRDRALVSEAVFALWRHWGVLALLAFEPGRREAVEGSEGAPTARELEFLTAGAIYLEDLPFPLRRLFELDWPPAPATPAARAAALLRHFGRDGVDPDALLLPAWIAARLADAVPLRDYLARLRSRPPLWLRAQNCDPDELASELRAAGLDDLAPGPLPGSLKVENARINLFTLPAFRAGKFEVQDLASQAVGCVAAPRRGERWLDLCAGAGGKTLQLAELMNRTGEVVATDLRSYKLDDLRRRARRSGFPNIRTVEYDGKKLKRQLRGVFDGVLVDAPCSCSGVWRRNPDGRWTLKESEIAEMAALQLSILNAAAAGVKEQGVLIYATCSVFPEENRGVVESFLAAHPEFELEPCRHPLRGEETAGLVQILPSDGDCDALFAARLRRRATPE